MRVWKDEVVQGPRSDEGASGAALEAGKPWGARGQETCALDCWIITYRWMVGWLWATSRWLNLFIPQYNRSSSRQVQLGSDTYSHFMCSQQHGSGDWDRTIWGKSDCNFPDNMQLNWLLTCMMPNTGLKSAYYQRRSIKSAESVARSHTDSWINVMVVVILT